MSQFLRILVHEYRQRVLRLGFLLALLGPVSFILIVVVAVGVRLAVENDTSAIGYVDHSGLLANPLPAPPSLDWPYQSIPIYAYASESAAQAALERGEIGSYYILPADYLATRQVQLYYHQPPYSNSRAQFKLFLRRNLLADQPSEVAWRVLSGIYFDVQPLPDASGKPQAGFNVLFPMLLSFLFSGVISVMSGYLSQSLADEKSNRTLEMMITTVSPNTLMSAKITASLAVGGTQLLVWGLLPVSAGFFLWANLPLVRSLVSLPLLALAVGLLLLALVMNAGLITAVNAIFAEPSEAQTIVGLVLLPSWLPYMLLVFIIYNPNSPLAVALSLFPLSAPVTLLLRAGLSTLPAWQYAVSLGGLALSGAGSVWLAGRALRFGLLRSGQNLRLRQLFRRRTEARP
jgi:ABC-2 type transport system permease protein